MTGEQQGIALTLIMALTLFFFLSHPLPALQQPASVPSAGNFTRNTGEVEFQVEIDGNVNRRGIYVLKEGMTILDAIDKAGGVSEKLSLDSESLLMKIGKNCRVNVVSGGEGKGKVFIESLAAKKMKILSIPVNINMANLEELDTLPGIGPKTAQAIIDYRETYGEFSSPEDLLNVRGIGPKKLAAIRPHIAIRRVQSSGPQGSE